MRRIYLIDFDGTITKQDTLDFLAKTYFPESYKEWGEKLMSGEDTVSDWLMTFEKALNDKGIRERDYALKLLKEIEIDEGFVRFIAGHKSAIVSGGFVYNIKKVLSKYDVDEIDIYANEIEFHSDGKIEIKMSLFNEKCGKSGVCKKNILFKHKEKYDEVVFIGDGITDICAAENADRVYAKRGTFLERHLIEKNIFYTPFDSFDDIIEKEKI